MRSMMLQFWVAAALDATEGAVDDVVQAVRAGDLRLADHDSLTAQLQAARARRHGWSGSASTSSARSTTAGPTWMTAR
jgi:hypothetical protein